MTNYNADDVTGPSLYGVEGTLAGPGSLTNANIAVATASITFDDKLLGKYVTVVPNGATIYVRMGRSADALTAVTTDAPYASLEKLHIRVTKKTQKMAFIGSAAVTNGLVYWCSQSTADRVG